MTVFQYSASSLGQAVGKGASNPNRQTLLKIAVIATALAALAAYLWLQSAKEKKRPLPPPKKDAKEDENEQFDDSLKEGHSVDIEELLSGEDNGKITETMQEGNSMDIEELLNQNDTLESKTLDQVQHLENVLKYAESLETFKAEEVPLNLRLEVIKIVEEEIKPIIVEMKRLQVHNAQSSEIVINKVELEKIERPIEVKNEVETKGEKFTQQVDKVQEVELIKENAQDNEVRALIQHKSESSQEQQSSNLLEEKKDEIQQEQNVPMLDDSNKQEPIQESKPLQGSKQISESYEKVLEWKGIANLETASSEAEVNQPLVINTVSVLQNLFPVKAKEFCLKALNLERSFVVKRLEEIIVPAKESESQNEEVALEEGRKEVTKEDNTLTGNHENLLGRSPAHDEKDTLSDDNFQSCQSMPVEQSNVGNEVDKSLGSNTTVSSDELKEGEMTEVKLSKESSLSERQLQSNSTVEASLIDLDKVSTELVSSPKDTDIIESLLKDDLESITTTKALEEPATKKGTAESVKTEETEIIEIDKEAGPISLIDLTTVSELSLAQNEANIIQQSLLNEVTREVEDKTIRNARSEDILAGSFIDLERVNREFPPLDTSSKSLGSLLDKNESTITTGSSLSQAMLMELNTSLQPVSSSTGELKRILKSIKMDGETQRASQLAKNSNSSIDGSRRQSAKRIEVGLNSSTSSVDASRQNNARNAPSAAASRRQSAKKDIVPSASNSFEGSRRQSTKREPSVLSSSNSLENGKRHSIKKDNSLITSSTTSTSNDRKMSVKREISPSRSATNAAESTSLSTNNLLEVGLGSKKSSAARDSQESIGASKIPTKSMAKASSYNQDDLNKANLAADAASSAKKSDNGELNSEKAVKFERRSMLIPPSSTLTFGTSFSKPPAKTETNSSINRKPSLIPSASGIRPPSLLKSPSFDKEKNVPKTSSIEFKEKLARSGSDLKDSSLTSRQHSKGDLNKADSPIWTSLTSMTSPTFTMNQQSSAENSILSFKGIPGSPTATTLSDASGTLATSNSASNINDSRKKLHFQSQNSLNKKQLSQMQISLSSEFYRELSIEREQLLKEFGAFDDATQNDENLNGLVLNTNSTLYNERKQLVGATKLKYLEVVIKNNDPVGMHNFLCYYQDLFSSSQLLDLLIFRYLKVNPIDKTNYHVQVLNMMKVWLLSHWYDFHGNMRQNERRKLLRFLQDIVKARDKYMDKALELENVIINNLHQSKEIGPLEIYLDEVIQSLDDLLKGRSMESRESLVVSASKRNKTEINRKKLNSNDGIYLTCDETRLSHVLKWFDKVSAENLSVVWTLLEFRMFKAIHHIIPGASAKGSGNHALNRKIESFNLMSKFFTECILSKKTPRDRASVIKRLLLLCQSLYKECHNFDGMMCVMSCLLSAPIYRLKKSWSLLPDSCQNLFKEYSNLLSPVSGYKEYRKVVTGLLQNLDERQAIIPYVGVYLTDLTFIQDGNKDHLPNPKAGRPLLNLEKRQLFSRVFSEICSIQGRNYSNLSEKMVYSSQYSSSHSLFGEEVKNDPSSSSSSKLLDDVGRKNLAWITECWWAGSDAPDDQSLMKLSLVREPRVEK